MVYSAPIPPHHLLTASRADVSRDRACIEPGGGFAHYGPFNYQGRYTSESNRSFDGWLKSRNPLSSIRDFEALDKLAILNRLQLTEDVEMLVNDRILFWHGIRS